MARPSPRKNRVFPRGPIAFGIWRPWALDIREGLAHYAKRRGWADLLPLWSETEDPALSLRQIHARGALLEVNPSQVESLLALRIPIVNLVIQYPQEIPFPSLALDDEAIGGLAAKHLVSQGCLSFGYAGPGSALSLHREKGFKNVLEKSGQRFCALEVSGKRPDWEALADPRVLSPWIRSLARPAGIFAFNDEIGRRILETCVRARRRVPDDIAVVGVDNDSTQQALSPMPLTSVIPDWRTLGYRAASVLDRLMSGSKSRVPSPPVPPAGLAVRRSSERTRSFPNPVDSALQFIAAHIGDGIGIEEVAAAEGLTRGSLNRSFMKHLGRRPGEEIRSCRLNEAARLLKTTALPVVEVAAHTGFQSPSYMIKAFRGRWDLTPTEYRRIHAAPSLLPPRPSGPQRQPS